HSLPYTTRFRSVVALHLRRIVRPAKRRERPQRRGEPGVENIFITCDEARALVAVEGHCAALLGRDDLLLDIVRNGVADGLLLGLSDEHLAVGTVPGRDLMAPPQLARDAPGLDVLHPLEIGLLPVARHERRRA